MSKSLILVGEIDFQFVIFVIMMVVYAIGWVAKKAKEATQAKRTVAEGGKKVDQFQPDVNREPAVQVNRQQPAGAGEGVQKEIDRFLREVMGQQAQPAAPDARPTQIVDIMGDSASDQAASNQEARTASKPGQRLHDRHLVEDRDLGHRINEHVANHLGTDRLEEHIREDLGPAVVTGAVETVRSGRVVANVLVDLLRSPGGIQQAMLVHEILSPPKGRRGRHGS